MMTFQTVLDHLTTGELSQLAIGGGPDSTHYQEGVEREIADEDKPGILRHMTLGLTALYKRFRLRNGQVTVALVENQLTYKLDPEFAVSNMQSQQINKYIVDTVQAPFDGQIIKIEEIRAEYVDPAVENSVNNYSRLVDINVRNNPYSIHMPNKREIQIPKSFGPCQQPQKLQIFYRADHPVLDAIRATAAPMVTRIELPEEYLQALLFFIASRVHNPIGMVQEFHSGNSYFAKYEKECQRLEGESVALDDIQEQHHFTRQGFI